MPTLAGIGIAFVVLLGLFRALEMFRARERRLPLLRRGLATDAAYWLFTPFVTKTITRLCVAGVAIPFAVLVYGKFDRELLEQGFGPAARLPLWAQAALILVIGDFVGYWMHRAFHGRRLWRFHAAEQLGRHAVLRWFQHALEWRLELERVQHRRLRRLEYALRRNEWFLDAVEWFQHAVERLWRKHAVWFRRLE